MIEISPGFIRKMVNVIFHVELSGNQSKVYCLSRASGGSSGWSFGKVQHDYPNNKNAGRILIDCGVSEEELPQIVGIKSHDHELIKKINTLLDSRRSRMVIDAADQAFVQDAISLFNRYQLPLGDDLRVAIALEYHTQMHISENGKFYAWIKALDTRIGGLGLLSEYAKFKRSLKWWTSEISPDRYGSHDHFRRISEVLKALEMKDLEIGEGIE